MAITVNNPLSTKASGSGSSLTHSSYVVGSEARTKLIVVVQTHGFFANPTVSGVTFNGTENFTQETSTSASDGFNDFYLEMWSLDAPTNTTANIVASFAASASDSSINIFYLSDCKAQVAEATGTADDLTSPHTASVTSITNGAMIVYGCAIETSNEDMTTLTGSGLTSDSTIVTTVSSRVNGTGIGSEVKATAGSESGGWTTDGTGSVIHGLVLAAAFEEDAPAGPTALSNPGMCIAIG